MDTSTANQNNSSGNHSSEQIPLDPTQLAMYSAFDVKARHLQHTGKRLKRKARRIHQVDPARLAETWLSSEWDPAFMSEITLQGLLDRTKADEQDESAMDMTVINDVRMGKYDIRALRLGHKVTPELRNALMKFNQDVLGENSVFPIKNDASRILDQFRENPYTLELLDQYTTSNKPKKLPTASATYYQSKPATRKVLEHFVRTTPVVEKCDDPRCSSRLVIVPKGEPGKPKDAPPTSYRVTMHALINNCLNPVASTLPLATDEIKKLHGKRFFLKQDAMHAFWANGLSNSRGSVCMESPYHGLSSCEPDPTNGVPQRHGQIYASPIPPLHRYVCR
jgi:hypothetical protein